MRFVSELKRRNVFRMAALYMVATWLIMQVAEVVVSLASFPEWTGQAVLLLLGIGFPIALVFSWFYELTPEGISLEKDVDPHESITHITGRRMDFIVISLLFAAVLVFAYDKFILDPGRDAVKIEAAVKTAREKITSGVATESLAKSIAVLPFVNLSGDPSDEYLSDGITEEIINSLSEIKNLRVVGRTSSFAFKSKNADLKTIGTTLGVANILEGSVRRYGDTLRITAQLISAGDGFRIWSHSDDWKFSDIFDLQREIAVQIANALRVELDVEVTRTLRSWGTESLEAYTWYLRGYHLLLQEDPTNIRMAAEAFENAINLDRQFVRAYAWYAVANVGLLGWGISTAEDPLRQAEAALAIGLEIDPEFSETRLALALLRAYKNDWSGAEEEFVKALDLDPDNPFAQRQWAYLLYAILGRPEEAVELSRKYLRREPVDLTAVGTNALSLAQLGQISKAESELRRIINFDPSYSFSYYRLATLYAFFRNLRPESLPWYIKSFELDPQSIQTPLDVARILLDLGNTELAEHWVRAAERNSAASPLGDFARYFIARYQADEELAQRMSIQLADSMNRVPEGYQYIMDFAWLRALHLQNPNLANQAYSRLYPELVSPNPVVNPWNHAAAISLADLMLCCGDKDVAIDLLDKSLPVLMGATDIFHYPAISAAYSLKGELEMSLEALSMAIQSGWRREWWLLERDRIFEPLWELPAFRSMVGEIRTDMSSQLTRLQAIAQKTEVKSRRELN